MVPTVRKSIRQFAFVLAVGTSVAVSALVLLPAPASRAAMEIVDLPVRENSQESRSVSPESMVLAAVKAVLHALMPSSLG